jgi:hypothetical protein
LGSLDHAGIVSDCPGVGFPDLEHLDRLDGGLFLRFRFLGATVEKKERQAEGEQVPPPGVETSKKG